MDPGTLFMLTQPQPHELEQAYARFAGSVVPVVIPLAWAPPRTAAHWALAREDTDFHLRIRLALQAGLEEVCWPLIRDHLGGRAPDARLQQVLQLWSARAMAQMAIPASREPIIMHGFADHQSAAVTRLGKRTLSAVKQLYSSLPWPRWAGPVVVLAPQADGLVPTSRPALPILRLPPVDHAQHQPALAQLLSDLVLSSAAPPAWGWPPWLSSGLGAAAAERATGQLPSPLRSLRARQRAGLPALRQLLSNSQADNDDTFDPELAYAVVVLLTSERRRQALPTLLDLLRNEVGSIRAIEIAYGLDLEAMLRER